MGAMFAKRLIALALLLAVWVLAPPPQYRENVCKSLKPE
jgi:hypothetical protein